MEIKLKYKRKRSVPCDESQESQETLNALVALRVLMMIGEYMNSDGKKRMLELLDIIEDFVKKTTE